MVGPRADHLPVEVTTMKLDGFDVYQLVPYKAEKDRHVVPEIHGGGFINFEGDPCRILSSGMATALAVSVEAVDYRMPLYHPIPTPLDDCFSAYRALLEVRDPKEIVVMGGSPGGKLAAALLRRARDAGLPLPAAAVLVTPAVDLTNSGESLHTNRGLDNVLASADAVPSMLYAQDHDLLDPYVSPLFGNFEDGFSPTLLTSGTRDLFLSNTVLMHRVLRRAGIEAELHVMEAAGHEGFSPAAPEDLEIDVEIMRFARRHWTEVGTHLKVA
jgi:epsilon-lactone hydrolase